MEEGSYGRREASAYNETPQCGRCKNCFYWNARFRPTGPGYCDFEAPEYEGGTDGFEVEDPYVGLITGPLFGCVQFKEK